MTTEPVCNVGDVMVTFGKILKWESAARWSLACYYPGKKPNQPSRPNGVVCGQFGLNVYGG